jgi:hypothetical protein
MRVFPCSAALAFFLDDATKDEATTSPDAYVNSACATAHLVDGPEAVDDGEEHHFLSRNCRVDARVTWESPGDTAQTGAVSIS